MGPISEDEELVALLRTLLSEGRIVHGTVEGEGKRTARRIEKEGPTGLIVTTTEGFVDPEMETRCLSLTTDDTPEQTGGSSQSSPSRRGGFEAEARL